MDRSFCPYLLDLLEPLGGVAARRMFSGRGLFRGGVMFAIVVGDSLYLKADDQNRPSFVALGLEPFTYRRGERMVALGYFAAPAEALESSDALRPWAEEAFAAALRVARMHGRHRKK